MDLIIRDPEIGDQKKGDLSAFFVYKFKIGNSKWLLGYTFNRTKEIITWHAVGRHENFYRDAKKK